MSVVLDKLEAVVRPGGLNEVSLERVAYLASLCGEAALEIQRLQEIVACFNLSLQTQPIGNNWWSRRARALLKGELKSFN